MSVTYLQSVKMKLGSKYSVRLTWYPSPFEMQTDLL